MRSFAYVSLIFMMISPACQTERVLTDAERVAIVHSVDSATRAFLDAEREQDPDRILAHVAPEFYMYNDGMRVEYDAIASQVREMFPALQRFESVWEPIEVTPLGRDHALVSLTFRDRVIDASGAELRLRGPTSLVWERRNGGWVIIYADADHYPDSEPWPDSVASRPG